MLDTTPLGQSVIQIKENAMMLDYEKLVEDIYAWLCELRECIDHTGC